MQIKFKKIYILVIGTLVLIPTFALAAKSQNTNAEKNTVSSAGASQAKVESLKTRGNQEIDRRVTLLNQLTSKIDGLKKLTADQKSQFSSEIKQNIDDLTALKTKINADTDLDTLKADVKLIVDSYRVYAIFMPKIHLLAGAAVATEIATNLTALADKLDVRIKSAAASGTDATIMNAELSDMRAKITSAISDIKSAEDAALSAVPSGYPENRSTLQASRTSLKSATTNLLAAKLDASKIIRALKPKKTNSNKNTNS